MGPKSGGGVVRSSYLRPVQFLDHLTVIIRGEMKNQHFCIFGPIALKRIEHVVLVSDPMFYSFQSDWTKNKKVLVFFTPHFCREKF